MQILMISCYRILIVISQKELATVTKNGSGIFYRLNYIKSKIKMSKAQRLKIKNVESNCTSFVTRLIYDKQRYTEIQITLTIAIILTHLLSTLLTTLIFRTLASIIHQNSINYSLVIVFM